jgi:hypothetical protein
LLVSASNVVNNGLLSAGAGGQLRLEGKKLNLSRGGLEIRPVQGLGFTFVSPTNFLPDVGIYDNYWGGVTNDVIDSSTIVGGGVISPPHVVTNANGFPFITQLLLNNPFVSVYTNILSPTNRIVQVAFIGTSDPNIGVTTRFAPSPNFNNVYRSIVVEVSFVDTNVVTGVPQFQPLYFVDRLASDTNYTVLANAATFPPTYRPAVYDLTRTAPLEFSLGTPGNGAFDPGLIYNSSMVNPVVTNFYAAYSALVDPAPFILPQVEGLSITNQPGRVEIVADELDMRGTRVRGNSFVTISTKHLIGSTNAIVDAPNLSYSLVSTNGNLHVLNLGKDTVNRFGGTLSAWSGLWTNQTGIIVTNIGPDPNDTNMPPMLVTNLATNFVDVGIHVLMLDAALLQSAQSVLTHDLLCRSTNIVIDDNLNVVEKFLLDGQSFTLNGRLALSGTAQYWTSNTAPTLQYFTNNGILNMGNAAFFGSDRSQPYSAIVNNGTMNGPSYHFRTAYFDNIGQITSMRDLFLETSSGKLDSGSISAGGDLNLTADDIKIRSHGISAGAGLFLKVKDLLVDAGVNGTSFWSVQNGFHLLTKPTRGDLFGVTLSSFAPSFANPLHSWAAEDRGATPAGYSNNVAIGNLTLDVSTQGLLTFSSVGARNGLYVDFLNLSTAVASNLTNTLEILPGLVIYFAAASVPAEQLDGQLGGRLRWVKEFTGPNSSVDVTLPDGRVLRVNSALRNSPTIDSDADGIANGNDPQPFDGVAITTVALTNVPTSNVLLSWKAAANTVYQLESATTLSPADWQLATTVTNAAATNTFVTAQDPFSPSTEKRFYRVRYNP